MCTSPVAAAIPDPVRNRKCFRVAELEWPKRQSQKMGPALLPAPRSLRHRGRRSRRAASGFRRPLLAVRRFLGHRSHPCTSLVPPGRSLAFPSPGPGPLTGDRRHCASSATFPASQTGLRGEFCCQGPGRAAGIAARSCDTNLTIYFKLLGSKSLVRSLRSTREGCASSLSRSTTRRLTYPQVAASPVENCCSRVENSKVRCSAGLKQ